MSLSLRPDNSLPPHGRKAGEKFHLLKELNEVAELQKEAESLVSLVGVCVSAIGWRCCRVNMVGSQHFGVVCL